MLNIKVLRSLDADQIIQFERDILSRQIDNEIERELFTWKAPWRLESLEHYLPLGWSFAAWEGKEGESPLLGYFLAQPLVHFNGFTQSLWLEHLQGQSEEVKNLLCDIAYKTCREKHYQKLLLAPSISLSGEWPSKIEPLAKGIRYIKTSKFASDE